MPSPPTHREPFQSPQSPHSASCADPTAMPLFCAVMFTLSLLSCVLRISILIFAGLFFLSLPVVPFLVGAPAFAAVGFVVFLSEAGSASSGLSANIGLLRKRGFGVRLGYWTVAAVVPALVGWFALLAMTDGGVAARLDQLFEFSSQPRGQISYVWETVFSLVAGSPSRLLFFRVLFTAAYLVAVRVFARRMRASRQWEPPNNYPLDDLGKDELLI